MTIRLYSSAGAPAGTAVVILAAKDRWSQLVNSIFSVSKPFTGYAVITATQPVSAAALWTSGGTVAAIPAQPYDNPAGARLYSTPLLTGGQTDTRLNLVNTGTRAVTYMIRAYGDNGTQVGQTVNGRLERGEQFWGTAGERLGTEAREVGTGSLVIETDGPLVGDVALQGALARAALTLTEPQPSWVIPYIPGGAAALSIHNPGPNAAAVRVRVMAATGATVGTVTVNIGAQGRTSQVLAALVPAAALLIEGRMGGGRR